MTLPTAIMLECDNSTVEYSIDALNSSSAIARNAKNVIDVLFTSLLHTSPAKHHGKIYIKNPESTRQKLSRLIECGTSCLQVVSDFDQTMSKHMHNGVRYPSCHGIFERDPELTEEAKEKLKSVTEKYRPIEFDPQLTDAEKTPYMIEWWTETHRLIVDCKIHRTCLAKIVNECEIALRDKVCDFCKLLQKHKIPLMVFSAGLGDVIQLLLERFNIYTENVRVVSNLMIFDDNDVISGFTEPIIHTFNKTASIISSGEYATISSQRPCVMLLGDSTGDVHMADGATVDDPTGASGTVLRIGFLNVNVEESLEKYQSIYDIVLVDDETFNIPLKIMQCITQCHEAMNGAEAS